MSLPEAWEWLLAAAAALVLISNAIEKIMKAIKAAKAPNEAQDKAIKNLDTRLEKVERHLANDNDKIQKMDLEHKAVLKALVALLDHSLDGNNVKQMQDAKKELICSLTEH